MTYLPVYMCYGLAAAPDCSLVRIRYTENPLHFVRHNLDIPGHLMTRIYLVTHVSMVEAKTRMAWGAIKEILAAIEHRQQCNIAQTDIV